MTSSLKLHVERLESSAPVSADVEWARAIMHAFDMVRDHPEQASDADRALAAAASHEEWSDAFGALIDAAGGLAAAVRGSYELEAAEKAKQIEDQVVKQVPAE